MLRDMYRQMISEWKPDVRMLETDLHPFFEPHFRGKFATRLLYSEGIDAMKKLTTKYPAGTDMGDVIGFTLYQRSEQSKYIPIDPQLRAADEGLKFLQDFLFQGANSIRSDPDNFSP